MERIKCPSVSGRKKDWCKTQLKKPNSNFVKYKEKKEKTILDGLGNCINDGQNNCLLYL